MAPFISTCVQCNRCIMVQRLCRSRNFLVRREAVAPGHLLSSERTCAAAGRTGHNSRTFLPALHSTRRLLAASATMNSSKSRQDLLEQKFDELIGSRPEYHPLEPLDNPVLDRQSKFLCQLLDDMHLGVSERLKLDRPTTERCNKILEQLSGGKITEHKGRAARAHAILWRMGRFFQRDKVKKEGELLPYPFPHPTRDTFFAVLKLYATQKGVSADRGPRRAEEIVKCMEDRYNMGEFDMRPNVICWNQVLSAWSECTDPEKAFHAATFLNKIKDDADYSSYFLLFRACAVSDTSPRSKQLSSEVALKVWKDFERRSSGDAIKTTSHLYSQLMAAVGHMEHNKPRRTEELRKIFQSCCKAGQVNAFVLVELRKATTSVRFADITKTERGVGDAEVTLRAIPEAWKRNADQGRFIKGSEYKKSSN